LPNAFRATLDGRVNQPQPMGFKQDAFSYDVTIPPPLLIPPVLCITIPNEQDDVQIVPPISCIAISNDYVNSSTTAPVNGSVDPTGRIPVRIQQDCFAHVDDVIYDKPTLLDIGGEPIQNWDQFVDTRRSFPTQVTINHRVVKNNVYTSIMPTLPNLFFCYRPKRVGVIRSRSSWLDPTDFQQGEN
jgi:hypothetical protein